MTAKEYLRSIKYLDNAINAKLAELDRLKRDMCSIRGVTYDGDKVQGGITDSMRIVDKIIELNNVINAEIDRLVDMKSDAHNKIEKVCNEKFISLLTDIYINGYTLEQVAERLNVNYRTVCRWYGEALQIFRRENNMT